MEQGKKRRWLRPPSPAMIVACLALFVALGGTSYAATKLAANSVGSKQIKSNAVTAAKIKNGAITTAKLKDGAVTTAKLPDGAVTTAKLPDGAVTTAKLPDGAVTTAKLPDGAVATAKIADGAVSTTKFAAIPGGRVRSNATQAIATNTLTPLAFNTVDLNTGSVFDVAQPTRLTAPVAGTYVITASISWANSALGIRELHIRLNGGPTNLAVVSDAPTALNTAPEQNVATTCHLSAGDYVQAVVWQTSGGPLDSWNSPNDAPLLTLNWIAP